MPERNRDDKTVKKVPAPWSVPVAVADVSAETGRHFELTADADARAAIARIAGIRELPRLAATFDVTRQGEEGLRVVGQVTATVGQNCVVTLEPLSNEIHETIHLVFGPSSPEFESEPDEDDESGERSGRSKRNLDGPEPLLSDSVDLGALATEFLILGIDPYPRKPDAKFEPPQDGKPDPGPFAVLAGLTAKDRKDRNDH
jgi:Large ribosomal RNA subunit accumulation protein YceD